MRALDTAPESEYIGSMKVKTSITLSEDLLKVVDKRTKQQKKTRSDFIEAAVQAFIPRPTRDEQNARDLEIINRNAENS